jgi:YaiO family outer membrane protein
VRRALASLALVIPLAARGHTVELSQGADALSGQRPPWRATALEAAWTGERGAAIGGGIRELSRFDRDDVEGTAWAQAPAGPFTLALDASASPTFNFVPRWRAGVRADRRLGAGWVASLGAAAARYDGDVGRTTVAIGSGGVERYWGRWRAAATTTAVELGGEWSAGERLALDLYYGDGGRAGASIAAGRELESLGGGRVLRSDVLGGAVAGAHPVGGGWAVTWEIAVVRQGEAYTRTGGRLGLRRRF